MTDASRNRELEDLKASFQHPDRQAPLELVNYKLNKLIISTVYT